MDFELLPIDLGPTVSKTLRHVLSRKGEVKTAMETATHSLFSDNYLACEYFNIN